MLKYRPDIDGLRAIAVGSVLLYHLKESLLPGGFVGVDIFFVISGYLITKLIVGELSNSGEFSFKRFYLRRIRRLFPALFATLLFSIALAYYLFSPAHLVEFAQSLIASILSISNFFFWNLSGYFDSDSSLKPLLHTWSLSVEEQFYLLWPAILVGLFALNSKKAIPIFIILMGALSLLLNWWFFSEQTFIVNLFSKGDASSSLDIPSTVFYWLPFRVFEFSIGAILVWTGNATNKRAAELTFAVGLLMVLISLFALNSKMEFPGTAALLPCIGAALMIFSGPQHRLSWIVSNKAMVGIGLISYSLYLIHWPLIVFYQYSVGREFSSIEAVLVLSAAVLLAFVMYRFVEQPFRKAKAVKTSVGTQPSNRPFLIGSGLSVLLIIAISANAVASQGWLWRYPADVVAQLSYKKGDYSEFFWANMHSMEVGFENNGKPKVLIIGDSMAADLINVLVAADAVAEMDIATVNVGENCKSLFGLTDQQYKRVYGGASETCRQEHDRILAKQSELAMADTVVLASYWWDENHLNYIASSVSHLKALTDANIMVVGLKVQINNGIWFVSKNAFKPNVHKLRTPPHPKALKLNRKLKEQAADYAYFDLLDLFCNEQGCQRVTKEGYAIVFDDSHLSESGAKFLAQNMRQQEWFNSLLNRH